MARSITNADIEAALRRTKGMIYLAARELQCQPSTIYRRLARSPELKELHEALHGEVGDVAELKLYQSIQDGDLRAIAFYLRTKGKHRGYVERQEVSGPDGGAIAVETYSYGAASARLTAGPGADRGEPGAE